MIEHAYAPHSIRAASPPFCIMDNNGKVVTTSFSDLNEELIPFLTKPGNTICIKYDITWFTIPTNFDELQLKTKRIIFNLNTEEIRIVSKFKTDNETNTSESFVYKKESETELADMIPTNILILAKSWILRVIPVHMKKLKIK
jgi:hypothetical protein